MKTATFRFLRHLLLSGLLLAALRGETLTIATYNIENYTETNRITEAGYRQSYPKPEGSKRALRAVLHALNADVLLLQEMGPQPYLEELRRDLRTEGLDYPYSALVEASDKARHVALLSKRELRRATPHMALDFKYLGGCERVRRGVLEAVIATSGGDVTLWAVHLKSRYTERADDPNGAVQRAGEAMAIRVMILRRHPEPAKAHFAVLGDFNDSRTSRPLQAFFARGNTTITEPLPAADSRGETWTRAYAKEGSYERVDFILVSAGLKPAVHGGAARIIDIPETHAASDHRPVMMVLQF